MHENVTFRVKGVVPLLMQNGQLADPTNEYTKRIKELTSKRKKTDADHLAIADLEWEGSLYLDAEGRVVIPGEWVEGGICSAGKKVRLGDKVRTGVVCDGSYPLVYDGPKAVARLKADPRFRDYRAVVMPKNRTRVMRCRPIFPAWSLAFTVHHLPAEISRDDLIRLVEILGTSVGLSTYRPRYGRFVVESVDGEPSQIKKAS